MDGKMLNMKNVILFSLLFITVTMPGIFASPAVDWYGTVTIDTNASTDGAIVTAHINNSNATGYASDIVGTPDSGYYLIHVPCSVGDDVYFRVYNVSVNQSSQTCSGLSNELNLEMNQSANGVACSYAQGCSGGYCVHSICRSASTYCGDGHCDSGETCSSCVADCGACTTTTTGGGGGGGGAVTATTEDETTATAEYDMAAGTDLEDSENLQEAIEGPCKRA